MKREVVLGLMGIFIMACQGPVKEREIGFHPNQDEDVKNTGWYLGTQEAIDVVVALDKVWKERKFDEAATFFADSVRITRANGKGYASATQFLNEIEENENSKRITWDLRSIHSVDLSPDQGGEHVQANFRMKYTDSIGNETKWTSMESYYVVDGKVVWLSQFRQNPIQE